MNLFKVTAFYHFYQFPQDKLEFVKGELISTATQLNIFGLIVLGCEGINATVSGSDDQIERFKAKIRDLLNDAEVVFKDSYCEKIPFARFKVDLRPEIITTKDVTLSHKESCGTHLTPKQWQDMLENDPDVVVIDTRNEYETQLGVFENAIDPKITKFSDFGSFVKKLGLPPEKKYLLYCTGGIRCEKAVPEMKRLGYDYVYQLEGGILRYLEEYPNSHFKGECFVFDHRVSVDQNLQPSKIYKLCPHCGDPASTKIQCTKCGKDVVVCDDCLESQEKHSCSKNCAYHLRRSESNGIEKESKRA